MDLKERLENQTSHIEVSKQGLIDSLQAKGVTPVTSSFEDIKKAMDLVKVDPNTYSTDIATLKIGYNISNGEWYVLGKANGVTFNNKSIYQPTKEKAMKALFEVVAVNMMNKLCAVKVERQADGKMNLALGGSNDSYMASVVAGSFPISFNGDYFTFSASQATPLIYFNKNQLTSQTPRRYILGILRELKSLDEYPEEKVGDMQYGVSLIFDVLDLSKITLIRP